MAVMTAEICLTQAGFLRDRHCVRGNGSHCLFLGIATPPQTVVVSFDREHQLQPTFVVKSFMVKDASVLGGKGKDE